MSLRWLTDAKAPGSAVQRRLSRPLGFGTSGVPRRTSCPSKSQACRKPHRLIGPRKREGASFFSEWELRSQEVKPKIALSAPVLAPVTGLCRLPEPRASFGPPKN